MAKRLPPNTVRLYHRGTPAGQDIYPVVINERFTRTQNAPWPRRVVTGPVGADAEEFISSWTQDDYSGGFGILDANESTDTSRISFGVIDGRRPKSMCLPPLTTEITSPTWAESGGFYPLGDIGTQFYGAWANGISGWNHAAGTPAWHTVQNAWPGAFAPVGEAVMFCGGLFVPGGAQGFVRLSELTPATGTLTIAQNTDIDALAFGLYDGKLWAIDDENKLWMLTTNGAASGATTTVNWNTASDPGVPVSGLGGDLILDTSLTPTALINYPNAAGEETLWCITRAQGAYLFDPDEPRWIKSSIKEGAHPDWGIAAEVFRDGEDLFISGGGLDVTRFTTANVEVPLSGLNKDQGVPAAYQGSIKDLCSERSSLYALVQAGTSLAAGSPTTMWVLQETLGQQGSSTSPLAFETPNQVAIDTNSRVIVADTNNDRVLILSSAGAYVSSIGGLTDVSGVATDASNAIYAAWTTGSDVRLSKYSSAGVLSWTQTITTSGVPGHVATDSTHVYVTDQTNDVIYKRLCTTGASWSLGATYGPTYNSLAMGFPRQVALNAAGTRVYIADLGNNRLVVTDGSGVYVDSITSLTSITGVCVDSSGNIYTLSEAGTTMRLRQYDSSLALQWTANFGDDGGQSHVTTDGTHVWACDLLGDKVYKRLCSTGAAVSSFGSSGTGNGQFGGNGPFGIAVDATHLYVTDPGNDRVQKFLKSDGSYVAQWAVGAEPRGLALDATGDVLVADITADTVTRYTSSGTLIDFFSQEGAAGIGVASGDVLWVSNNTAGTIAVWDELAPLGASGTGNGQFDGPLGIDTDGTHLWVVDATNARVQKITIAGAYVAKWNVAAGSRGLALDASGDVWVCGTATNLLSRYSEVGVAQTSIVQSAPRGIGVTSTDILWVATGAHNLAKWDEESVTTEAVDAITWLGAWTGTAWCALWESSTAMTPTWMRISMKGQYALWWGNAAGVAYRQLLPPPFFNPAARVTLGVYPFAATGWMETVRFDAQMGGWDKIANHLFAMLDYAAADVYVDISYRTDADQFDSGLLDPPYRSWKRVDHIGRTLCWFDDTDTDPISGLPWREGEPFQWIQFRYDFHRGSDTFKTPIWLWHSMHFFPVPQDAASFKLKFPMGEGSFKRSPDEMAQTLRDLQTVRGLVYLQTGNARPSNPDWQTFFKVKVTQVKSEFVVGANNNTDEVIVLDCVEIGASDNAHTTLAIDTP